MVLCLMWCVMRVSLCVFRNASRWIRVGVLRGVVMGRSMGWRIVMVLFRVRVVLCLSGASARWTVRWRWRFSIFLRVGLLVLWMLSVLFCRFF